MRHKWFLTLLVVFIGGHIPAAAQTSTPEIVLAQERSAPGAPMFRMLRLPSSVPFTVFQNHGESATRFSLLFAEP
jgi:hypothetical protein